MSREIVREWYGRLPPAERNVKLVYDEITDKYYTPRQVLEEVERGTNLGRRLQEKIEAGRLTSEDVLRRLAKIRLRETIGKLPPQWGVATVGKVYSKEELMRMIEEDVGVGKRMIEMEMEEMQRLMRR